MSKPKSVYTELTDHEVLEIAKAIEELTPSSLKKEIDRAIKVEEKRQASMKKSRAKYEARHKMLLAKSKEKE